MVVQGLRGCTSVIVASRRLVWGSHFWEGESFLSSHTDFRATVRDLLGSGDGTSEMPGLSQFTDSGGRFAPITKRQIYTLTLDMSQDRGIRYTPGKLRKSLPDSRNS